MIRKSINKISRLKTPILIICFNRPQYVLNQIASLKNVSPEKIYLFSDGARNMEEENKVNEVRNLYLSNIQWECEIKTNFQNNNLGCSEGPIKAMKWFFHNETKGLILEDDIIPTTDFFNFIDFMLDYYADNKKIISISGCNLNHNTSHVFYSKIMNMWGWGTWSDRFDLIDFELNNYKNLRFKQLSLTYKLRRTFFDIDIEWANHWKRILDKTIKNDKNTWWDYQFIYNQIHYNKLSVFPPRNLIENVGFENDATHTSNNEAFLSKLKPQELPNPIYIPRKIVADNFFYEVCIKNKWAFYTRPNWKFYIGNFFKLFKK